MYQVIRTLAMVVTLLSLAATSGSDPLAAEENPCVADVKRLCGDVKPGQGRIQKCLKEHSDELSQECKDSLVATQEKIKSKLEGIAEACKGDAEKLCPDVEPGGGRILKCLLEQKDKLSKECKAAMN
jgi:hypothetical protein